MVSIQCPWAQEVWCFGAIIMRMLLSRVLCWGPYSLRFPETLDNLYTENSPTSKVKKPLKIFVNSIFFNPIRENPKP